MLQTPAIPALPTPGIQSFGTALQFPLPLTLDPVTLTVVLALVGIFIAALSVVLIYHWRRFQFELELFRRVEHWYLFGVAILLAAAVLGILIA